MEEGGRDETVLTSLVPLASSTLVAAPHTPTMVARVSVVPSPPHHTPPPTSREEGGGEQDGGVVSQPGAEKKSGSTDKTSGGDKDTLEEDRMPEDEVEDEQVEVEKGPMEVEEEQVGTEDEQVESRDGQVEHDARAVTEGTKYTEEDMSLTLIEEYAGGEEVGGGTEHREAASGGTEVRGARESGWETISQEDASARQGGEGDTEGEIRGSPGAQDDMEKERCESGDDSKLESSVDKSKEREEFEAEYGDETPEQDMNLQNLLQGSLDLENDTGPVHNSTPMPEEGGEEAEETSRKASGKAAEKASEKTAEKAVLGKTKKSRRSTEEGSRGKRRREGSGARSGEGEVVRKVVRRVVRIPRLATRVAGEERRVGVDAIEVTVLGEGVTLVGVGVHGPVEVEGETSTVTLHLRVFTCGALVWEATRAAWSATEGVVAVEPPLHLLSRGRYLLVARVRGAPCWRGQDATPGPLHSLRGGAATYLSFYDAEEKQLEEALYDDEVEETVEEMVTNFTSTQRGQFPFLEIAMA